MATAPRAHRGCARFPARSAPCVATACPARRSERLALSRQSPPCRPDVATARAACRGGRWGRTRRCVPGRPCYARIRTAGAGGRVRGQRKMRTRRRACGVGPRHQACAHKRMSSRPCPQYSRLPLLSTCAPAEESSTYKLSSNNNIIVSPQIRCAFLQTNTSI